MISNISVLELLKIKDQVKIIDIRSEQSYNNNHIENSINIPYEKLIIDPRKYLDSNVKYYLYCQKGISSYKVCQILTRLGYKVINILGGYEEWILQK